LELLGVFVRYSPWHYQWLFTWRANGVLQGENFLCVISRFFPHSITLQHLLLNHKGKSEQNIILLDIWQDTDKCVSE
jgi:hypothetical protein